jgi:hypothetical protein
VTQALCRSGAVVHTHFDDLLKKVILGVKRGRRFCLLGKSDDANRDAWVKNELLTI